MGKRGRVRTFRGRKQDLRIWGWGRISSCRELYTPLHQQQHLEPAVECRRVVATGGGVGLAGVPPGYKGGGRTPPLHLEVIPCVLHCFPNFDILIDRRSSYHMHEIFSTGFLERKTIRGTPYIYDTSIPVMSANSVLGRVKIVIEILDQIHI